MLPKKLSSPQISPPLEESLFAYHFPPLEELCNRYTVMCHSLQTTLARHEDKHEAQVFLQKMKPVASFSYLSSAFGLEIFLLADCLRATGEELALEESALASRLSDILKPLELELKELLAPLDRLYLEKVALFIEGYFFDVLNVPRCALTNLYCIQLFAPTIERYKDLQSAALTLAEEDKKTAASWVGKEGRKHVQAAMDALEVQYLLSGYGREDAHE